MSLKILLVDDDPSVTAMLTRFLVGEGFAVTSVNHPPEIGPALLQEWDLILCDMYLGSTTAVEVIKEAKRLQPATPFVIMTAHGSMDVAIDAIRGGAFDFVGKPVEFEHIRQIIRRASQAKRESPKIVGASEGQGAIIGRSPAIVEVYKWIARVAPLDSPVLIQGESGTGKELIARALHGYSPRAKGSFVPVNCAAIPEHLLESEMFGHLKGAFTGAVSDKPGLFREADGGTLFLDEIGELPLPMQSKLLRVLEDRQVRPVGSEKLVPVNIRLVAATNRSLEDMVRSRDFREDLYYRINGVPIRVPPLRERQEDVETLAGHYVNVLTRKLNREISLTQSGVDALKRHGWPGNVRELVRELERAAAMSATGMLGSEDFAGLGASSADGAAARPALMRSLDEVEKEHILSMLRQSGGNKQKAAKILKIDRKTLQRKLEQYDLPPGEE